MSKIKYRYVLRIFRGRLLVAMEALFRKQVATELCCQAMDGLPKSTTIRKSSTSPLMEPMSMPIRMPVQRLKRGGAAGGKKICCLRCLCHSRKRDNRIATMEKTRIKARPSTIVPKANNERSRSASHGDTQLANRVQIVVSSNTIVVFAQPERQPLNTEKLITRSSRMLMKQGPLMVIVFSSHS